jgi:hypothetical protein
VSEGGSGAPGGSNVSGWTPERDAIVREMWRDGFSFSQIAKALGDTTRGAVGGRVQRLGFARSPEWAAQVAAARRERENRAAAARLRNAQRQAERRPDEGEGPKPPVRHQPEPATPAARTLTALEPGQCHFPVGDTGGADQLFCAEPTADPECPYCSRHKRKAWSGFSEPVIRTPWLNLPMRSVA